LLAAVALPVTEEFILKADVERYSIFIFINQ
jgi:hypothetical protein